MRRFIALSLFAVAVLTFIRRRGAETGEKVQSDEEEYGIQYDLYPFTSSNLTEYSTVRG